MKELEGMWKCNEMPVETPATNCCVSIVLHIKDCREDGLQQGYLVRSELCPGWGRKLSLPVLIEVAAGSTLLRLKSHKHEIVDELHILLLNTERLLLRSIVNNQNIPFVKDRGMKTPLCSQV